MSKVYIFQADLYCVDCAEAIMAKLPGTAIQYYADDGADSDVYPQGPFPASLSDTPDHCGGCEAFLENPLTEDGRAYVAEAIRAWHLHGKGRPEILSSWATFYEIGDTLVLRKAGNLALDRIMNRNLANR